MTDRQVSAQLSKCLLSTHCVPQFICGTPDSTGMAFRDGSFERQFGLDEVMGMGTPG